MSLLFFLYMPLLLPKTARPLTPSSLSRPCRCGAFPAAQVCLFGSTEVDLKAALRGGGSDGDVEESIAQAVQRKKKQHAGMFELAKKKNRPMILIGG